LAGAGGEEKGRRTREGRGRDRKGEGREGREKEKGSEGIGKGREGKENGDRPPTIFGLKVALPGDILVAEHTDPKGTHPFQRLLKTFLFQRQLRQ